MSRRWRMVDQCVDCPFADSGDGLQLRRSLQAGRWREILADLRRGGHFTCHKTTAATGNGSNLMCAGAIAWQEARGYSSNYQRICERLDAMAMTRRAALRSGERERET
jgi:hypothetical protein